MINFLLRIIVIECCYTRGFLLKEESKHYFLSINVLFCFCGFIYCVVSLQLFSAVFFFSVITIDMVPNTISLTCMASLMLQFPIKNWNIFSM
jgi:hypothetical protein